MTKYKIVNYGQSLLTSELLKAWKRIEQRENLRTQMILCGFLASTNKGEPITCKRLGDKIE